MFYLYSRIINRKFKHLGSNHDIARDISINGPQYISIGNYFSIGKRCYLQVWDSYNGISLQNDPNLYIGDHVSIMCDCQISCSNMISIGDGVLLGNNVFITDNFHGDSSIENLKIPPLERKLISKGPVIIGDNVWIGRNVCIMPGVSIGTGSIIGANAVVTKNIPEYSIAAGVPAKVIRKNDI